MSVMKLMLRQAVSVVMVCFGIRKIKVQDPADLVFPIPIKSETCPTVLRAQLVHHRLLEPNTVIVLQVNSGMVKIVKNVQEGQSAREIPSAALSVPHYPFLRTKTPLALVLKDWSGIGIFPARVPVLL